MKIKSIFCMIILLTCICIYAKEFDLKIVRTIGDERNDYTFFSISSAVVSEDKNIYVADWKGHFIAKYTWNGLFKKRIGQKGQGPGDFNRPQSLNFSDNKLFVFDWANDRIATLDKDLNILNYIKLKTPIRVKVRYLYLIHNNYFIGDSMNIEEGKGNKIKKLKVIGQDGNIINSFFENIILKDKIDSLNLKQRFMLSGYAKLIIGIDQEKKNILITHNLPKIPAEFFLYTSEGKFIKSFTHELDKKYKFPIEYILNPPPKPSSYSLLCSIGSVFIYKEYFLVFLTYVRYEKNSTTYENYCLLFNHNGKLIQKKLINNKDTYNFFYITGDGYLLGKKVDKVIEKLYIFKIHFSDS